MSTYVSDDVSVTYDEPRDVLYISLGHPVPSYAVEDPEIEGLHYRYSLVDNRLSGITIVWFSQQDRSQLLRKLPVAITLPKR